MTMVGFPLGDLVRWHSARAASRNVEVSGEVAVGFGVVLLMEGLHRCLVQVVSSSL